MRRGQADEILAPRRSVLEQTLVWVRQALAQRQLSSRCLSCSKRITLRVCASVAPFSQMRASRRSGTGGSLLVLAAALICNSINSYTGDVCVT